MRARRAIIIGGGVAGTSLARSLAARNVRCTVLEKAGQLCAGATWHAAGLVTAFKGIFFSSDFDAAAGENDVYFA